MQEDRQGGKRHEICHSDQRKQPPRDADILRPGYGRRESAEHGRQQHGAPVFRPEYKDRQRDAEEEQQSEVEVDIRERPLLRNPHRLQGKFLELPVAPDDHLVRRAGRHQPEKLWERRQGLRVRPPDLNDFITPAQGSRGPSGATADTFVLPPSALALQPRRLATCGPTKVEYVRAPTWKNISAKKMAPSVSRRRLFIIHPDCPGGSVMPRPGILHFT